MPISDATRARLGARPSVRERGAAAPEASGSERLLAFRAAGAECAVALHRLREVVEVTAIAPDSGAPALRGTIDVRGAPVPILDLGAKLGAGETGLTPLTCALLLEGVARDRAVTVGLLVEDVSDVLEVSAADVAPPPRLGGPSVAGVRGVAKLPGRLVLVLDPDQLLSGEELAAVAARVERSGAHGT